MTIVILLDNKCVEFCEKGIYWNIIAPKITRYPNSTPASCIRPRISIRGLLLCTWLFIASIYGICSRKVPVRELCVCPETGLTLILPLKRVNPIGQRGFSNASISCKNSITDLRWFGLPIDFMLALIEKNFSGQINALLTLEKLNNIIDLKMDKVCLKHHIIEMYVIESGAVLWSTETRHIRSQNKSWIVFL